MNPIDQYVKCYNDTVDTELSFPELCIVWEVTVQQGIHIVRTGSLIAKGKVSLN